MATEHLEDAEDQARLGTRHSTRGRLNTLDEIAARKSHQPPGLGHQGPRAI